MSYSYKSNIILAPVILGVTKATLPSAADSKQVLDKSKIGPPAGIQLEPGLTMPRYEGKFKV